MNHRTILPPPFHENWSDDLGPETLLKHTALIIPARNEEPSIGMVLRDLPGVACVIVADNGSTDQTASIAREAGCVVVDEPIPGYGRACLAGMKELRSIIDQGDVDIRFVAFLDGDSSDSPEELPQMLQRLQDEPVDFVLGSRLMGNRERGAMPPQAIWGNRLACTLMNWIWATDYTDLGPFRVIRVESLMQLDMQDKDFGWTIEMQIKAKQRGLRVLETPANYRRRVGVSKISGTLSGTLRAGYKILYTIAKFAWQSRFPLEITSRSKNSEAMGSLPANKSG